MSAKNKYPQYRNANGTFRSNAEVFAEIDRARSNRYTMLFFGVVVFLLLLIFFI